jgi:hypothetical protein
MVTKKEKQARMTQKEKAYNLLKSRKWTPMTKVIEVTGSLHGDRRVRELRADGYEIKTRKGNAANRADTEYRLVGKA